MDLGSVLLLMQFRKALKHPHLTSSPSLSSTKAEAHTCSTADLIRKFGTKTVSKSIHGIRMIEECDFLYDGCFKRKKGKARARETAEQAGLDFPPLFTFNICVSISSYTFNTPLGQRGP